jgi:hypothetical protein
VSPSGGSENAREGSNLVFRHVRVRVRKEFDTSGWIDGALPVLLEKLLGRAARHEPREVWPPYKSRRGVHEHESERTLGKSCGEQRRKGACISDCKEHRRFRPSGVHHGSHVIHPGIERGHAGYTIGHTCPALIERNQSSERSQTFEEASNRRVLPVQLDVMGTVRDVDEVAGSVAYDLVREVDLAALGVTSLGPLHESSHSLRGCGEQDRQA